MITISDYLMGREQDHGLLLSTEMRRNAAITVDLANKLIERAKAAGVTFEISPRTGTLVTSGWRPPAINASTQGAKPNSRHLTCQAVDLYDPDGDLDEWLLANQEVLKELGLWLEHPAATKTWCHLQTVPPRSGNRVFYP